MFFISLHGVIINDALPLSFYDFLNMQQFFCVCFLLVSMYLTTLILESMYKDRKDILRYQL